MGCPAEAEAEIPATTVEPVEDFNREEMSKAPPVEFRPTTADWEMMGNEEDVGLTRDGQRLASPVADAAAQVTAAATAGCGGCTEEDHYFSQAPMPNFGLDGFNSPSGDDSGDDSADGGGDGSGNGGGMGEYGPDGFAADGLDEYGFPPDLA